MSKEHTYCVTVRWTGNTGSGTLNYRSYERSHTILGNDKPAIYASSDPAFRGDKTKYNPEELLVASLSGCHMLWFLHLCAEAGVVVTEYTDTPTGIMKETKEGGGRFDKVILNPAVTVQNEQSMELLDGIHKRANELCFIANSVNFPVLHQATARYLK